MLPEEFVKRIKSQHYIDSMILLKSLESQAPPSIRLNRQKWNRVPAGSTPVKWCDSGFYLSDRPEFTYDPLFHAGCYYSQEASGMFLGTIYEQLFNDVKNIRVLDLCGAPGGKSTHLASLISQNGFLVTNDVIRSRASTLAENITKWGLSNTIVTQSDPSEFGKIPGFFDLILVDAPCSGEGMFPDQVALREWSADNAYFCSVRQKRILKDVWPALKSGGFMIYSTCTFNPDENEKNILWLSDNMECKSERIDIKDPDGITEIKNNGIYGYGFYPGKIRGGGFFITVIRKTADEKNKIRMLAPWQHKKITAHERKTAEGWTSFPGERLYKSGQSILAIPCSYNDLSLLSGTLRIIRAGTEIFTAKGTDHQPSHELAMSVCLKKESFPSADLNLQQSLQYLGRGRFYAGDILKGWNLVSYEGIPLGFVNNVGNRVNNYYPVGWRIRKDTGNRVDLKIVEWDLK